MVVSCWAASKVQISSDRGGQINGKMIREVLKCVVVWHLGACFDHLYVYIGIHILRVKATLWQ